MKILVLEDDLIQINYFSKLVSHLEFDFVFCLTATEAIQKIKSETFDAAFLDLAMPEEDGFDVVRSIKEHCPATAIIFVSSSNLEVLRSAVLIAEMLGIKRAKRLQKPISGHQIESILNWVNETADKSIRPQISQKALSLDSINFTHDLVPFYQPIFDSETFDILGVEVLARLKHADLGILVPGQFFEFVEKHNLDATLTKTIVDKCLSDYVKFLEINPSLRISINVSHKELAGKEFLHYISNAVDNIGIKTSQVIIEVTEKEFVVDESKVLENLCRLSIKGFQISMDDYGVGVSTISTLMCGVFNEVKIDMDFVRKSTYDHQYKIALRSMVKFAEELEFRVVCEGIENYREYRNATSCGDVLIQGYLFSKPLDFKATLAILENKKNKQNEINQSTLNELLLSTPYE